MTAPYDYPTDALLEKIKTWRGGFNALLALVRKNWAYAEAGYWDEQEMPERNHLLQPACRQYKISTAGWSGNESLIDALENNEFFWMMCWIQTRKGGHYIFEVRKEKQKQ